MHKSQHTCQKIHTTVAVAGVCWYKFKQDLSMQKGNMCIFNQVFFPHFSPPLFLCCCSAVAISAKMYDLPTPGFSSSVCNDFKQCGFAGGFNKAKLATTHSRISVTGRSYYIHTGKDISLKVGVFVCLQVKGGNFQSSATDQINCLPLLECECEVAESSWSTERAGKSAVHWLH